MTTLKAPPELDPHLAATLPDPLLERPQFLQGVARQGDLVAHWYGAQRRVLVNDPALIDACMSGQVPHIGPSPVTSAAAEVLGEGLLTIQDLARWRPRRVLIQREISYRNVRRHAEQIARLTQAYLARWTPGRQLDVQAEMARLTLDGLGESVFTTDFETFRGLLMRAMQALTDYSTLIDTSQDSTAARRELDAAIAQLDSFVQALVAQRRIAPVERRDILDVLLAAVEQGGSLFHDGWVRDEAVTLIIAGHDTTALTTTMALYLLARNPEVAAALRAELRAAIGRGVPESQLADEVALARQVVEETLRLYPPLPTLTRSVRQDIELGGYAIAAGTVLVFSPWVTQRDARFFADPARFDPWRFAGERRKQTIGPAYFPFGAGPRICVGNHFALLEAAVIVALVTLQRELLLCDTDEPAMAPLNVLRCRDGLWARVKLAPADGLSGQPAR